MSTRPFLTIILMLILGLSWSPVVSADKLDEQNLDLRRQQEAAALERPNERIINVEPPGIDPQEQAREMRVRNERLRQDLQHQTEMNQRNQLLRSKIDTPESQKSVLQKIRDSFQAVIDNLKTQMEQTKQRMQDMRQQSQRAQEEARRKQQEAQEHMRDARLRYEDQKRQNEMTLDNLRHQR